MGKTNYPISRFADSVGDGSGSIEGNTNSSVTPLTLKIAPGLTETFRIARMIVYIEDTSIDSGGYGGIGALTNGVHAHIVRYAGEAGEVILWDITHSKSGFLLALSMSMRSMRRIRRILPSSKSSPPS